MLVVDSLLFRFSTRGVGELIVMGDVSESASLGIGASSGSGV
jgi:hypothetical protein